MISSAPNSNRFWSDLIVEELVRLGVTRFVIAPGSRSTPLVTAVADNPRARSIVHFDERGTAFHALGIARATGAPAAWITTSGTAVANGFPAVIEAAQDGVPLILLTGDRPPELRDTGANQTIDQQHIFGRYVRWFFDLPVPNVAIDPHFVLTTVDQAVYRATAVPAGPVHLNCMFREPLAPVEDGLDHRAVAMLLSGWLADDRPLTRYIAPLRTPPPAAIDSLVDRVRDVERGVIVAGRLSFSDDVSPIAALAERLGWPLLADVTSHLRFRAASQPHLPYHVLFSSEAFREGMRPQVVIEFGAPPVSRRLMQYVAATPSPARVLVSEGPSRIDPEHRVGYRFDCGVGAFCTELARSLEPVPSQWLDHWQTMARVAEHALDEVIGEEDVLSEPWIARSLGQLLPPRATLFLGNSMPVRDADSYAGGNQDLRIAANRGASGIDGTLATATGFANARKDPVALVIGDLALLHDLNSLGLARTLDVPFLIVAINNDGGAIFSFLTISEFEEVFEPYFGTPHGLRFESAAAMFGIPYSSPASRVAFEGAVQEGLGRPGPTLIEVTTDRRANAELHRRIDERVALAVTRAFAAGGR